RRISRFRASSNLPSPACASRAPICGSSAAIDSGGAGAGLEFCEPGFKSLHALSELAQVISAVPRWSGSGPGPSRACMRSSLGNLHRLGDLRVRSRKQAGNLLGYGLVRCEPGQLGLPQVEVTPGQLVEFGASSFTL